MRHSLSTRCAAAAVAAAVLACGVAVTGAAASTHPAPAGIGALVPSVPHEALPAHGGTADSLNWSGYAVTPSAGGVTAVTSTFTVPAAGLIPPGFAATWTGIGGYASSDLIQAGTTEDSTGNPILGPQYFAWYELLPDAETEISGCSGDPGCTVKPGDRITVQIQNGSGKSWNIAMADAGRWTWSKDVTYGSSRSSAEWILEAPTLAVAQTPIAPVGTVSFGPVSTYTQGGVTRTIAQGDPTQIILTPGAVNEATPSALAADGQSFNDCAYSQACPAPQTAPALASTSTHASANHKRTHHRHRHRRHKGRHRGRGRHGLSRQARHHRHR